MSKEIFFIKNLILNITNNFLEITLITSRTRGAIKSSQKPFGAGKSTFALHLSYILHFFKEYNSLVNLNLEDKTIWNQVFKHLSYTIDDTIKIIFTPEENDPKPAVIWDDIQLTAPATQKIPFKLRQQIDMLTIARPYVSNIIGTAPSFNDIAKPLRNIVKYEVIIPSRGKYEVQMIERRKNFYNPINDKNRMIYISHASFPPLPENIEKRYLQWRHEQVLKISKKTQPQEINLDTLNKTMIPISEYSKHTGKAPTTIRKMCEEGEIPCVKSSNRWFIVLNK